MSSVDTYLRQWAMPHVLCPGCAHGIVMRAFLEAVDQLQINQDKLAVVAGIGCSSRLAGYIDFCTLHGTHGRAPAFATGIKLARPEMKVVVFTGDGDALAIGGNHMIHTARRNVDMTVLLLNNSIYGMTGGQAAPTTPPGAVASTAPQGSIEPSFDSCELMIAAGATYVARVLAANPLEMTKLMAEAMDHEGFSFIEVISDCPEYFGRYNQLGSPADMLVWMAARDADVVEPLSIKRYVDHVPKVEVPPGLDTGVLHKEVRPVFVGVREVEQR